MKKYFFLMCMATTLVICSCKREDVPAQDEQPEEVPQTRFKSLNYLYQISGEKTVAGIHNREPNKTPAKWTDEITSTTGKVPGLWSGDFLFQADNIDNRQIMIEEALNQWEQGALVNLMWHACNPALEQPCGWDEEGVLSKLTDDQWKELVTDGTPLNTNWKGMMDEVSVYLQYLEDRGVEVLFRPLHEMNQGKFWWGGRPGANGTRKLWQLTHDYMTKTKGLSNLIWVWDLQDFPTLSSDLESYNPGEEYWDVAALDIYDGGGYTQTKYNAMVKVSGGKPIAIGECEKLPTAAQLVAQPKWSFFMGWSELVFRQNTEREINDLHHSPRIITLDEMPGW
ncbi:glycoside hydrolase family 26 protein [Pontibacter mangrovi]|uniref:Glycoside hydrolase n=1 Tax=Pontibacter mangrovi TaxID=2589816 RepID=A0A501W0G1_9BACT|nr:glycosyl hydrolase [Pontibacter mangrovi]TPE43453.1 glycoside hydrolase [Pontibacter mangrovi]